MTIGPNVKALMIRKMAHDMVPDGGGFVDGLAALTDGDMGSRVQAATAWVKASIAAVKQADNTYGDDEAIAGEILRQIAEKA